MNEKFQIVPRSRPHVPTPLFLAPSSPCFPAAATELSGCDRDAKAETRGSPPQRRPPRAPCGVQKRLPECRAGRCFRIYSPLTDCACLKPGFTPSPGGGHLLSLSPSVSLPALFQRSLSTRARGAVSPTRPAPAPAHFRCGSREAARLPRFLTACLHGMASRPLGSSRPTQMELGVPGLSGLSGSPALYCLHPAGRGLCRMRAASVAPGVQTRGGKAGTAWRLDWCPREH
nr:uncharacterized protein LOC116285111 [Vicugna pacos]